MKLRIKDNSIRLRLTRTEIQQLASADTVTAVTDFGSSTFRYLAEAHSEARSLSAHFEHGVISVLIPTSLATAWASSDTIGLYGDQPLASGGVLKIAVEKDFRCLDPNRDEDESDHFENPLAATGHAPTCTAE